MADPTQSRTPAVAYAAKSTSDEHGSIPTQLEDATRMAEREGWDLVETYRDEAFSAWSGDRGPGLAAATQHAERLAATHGRAILVVQHSDRLARGDGRQARHLGELHFWALKARVELRSVQDDSTFTSPLLVFAMGERNAEDSRRKALAVKAGMGRRTGKGMHVGGPRKYGYEYVRDSYGRTVPEEPLRVRPDEAIVVERIYRSYLAGTSQQGIQRELNRDGVPTANAREWHQATVRNVLVDPFYTGLVKSGDEWVPGRQAAIVSAETWLAAERLRAQGRKNFRVGGRPPSRAYLFTHGHLRCGRCGGPMVPRTVQGRRDPKTGKRWGGAYERYTCLTRIRDITRCEQKPVPRVAIDEATLLKLREYVFSIEDARAQIVAGAAEALRATGAQRADAEREAQRATGRLEKIERDYLDGQLPAHRYDKLLERLESEADAARAHLDQLEERERQLSERADGLEVRDELARLMLGVTQAMDGAAIDPDSVDEVRALLRRYFESFTVVVRDDGATLIPRLRADRLLETHDGVPLLPREAPPQLATTDVDGFTT